MHLLVSKESILNRIPVNLAQRQVFLLEGIRYCANSISLSYEQLYGELEKISSISDHTKPPYGVFYKVISEAWTVIDWTHRLTVLLSSISTKSDPSAIGENFAYLLKAREFRNTLQHIEERIDEHILSQNAPVWGTLAWIQYVKDDLRRTYVLMAGHPREGFMFRFNNPLAFSLATPIDHITLDAVVKRPTYQIESLDLSELLSRIKTIIRNLESHLETQFAAHEGLGVFPQDFFLSLDVRPDNCQTTSMD